MKPSAVPGVLGFNPGSTDPAAYPLTALSYGVASPSTLDAAVGKDYAAFLRYAAGPGQQLGIAPGQLPLGMAPLPDTLKAQTAAAAAAIEQRQARIRRSIADGADQPGEPGGHSRRHTGPGRRLQCASGHGRDRNQSRRRCECAGHTCRGTEPWQVDRQLTEGCHAERWCAPEHTSVTGTGMGRWLTPGDLDLRRTGGGLLAGPLLTNEAAASRCATAPAGKGGDAARKVTESVRSRPPVQPTLDEQDVSDRLAYLALTCARTTVRAFLRCKG
jgi:hypothetical protein